MPAKLYAVPARHTASTESQEQKRKVSDSKERANKSKMGRKKKSNMRAKQKNIQCVTSPGLGREEILNTHGYRAVGQDPPVDCGLIFVG